MSEHLPLAPLTVLVVDDSPVTRKMLIHALEMARIPLAEVREAKNGEEALFSIARSAPDLVLCDVHMPTMDGTELLERLSCGGWTPTLPVVMISSERGPAARSRLTAFGARACVEKPFLPEALGRVVRGVLGLTEVI
ncbi:MAG TPA: response regulator [Polyangiaceae bacterium]|nr:response regulator [Polyangiaceae bacterium]